MKRLDVLYGAGQRFGSHGDAAAATAAGLVRPGRARARIHGVAPSAAAVVPAVVALNRCRNLRAITFVFS